MLRNVKLAVFLLATAGGAWACGNASDPCNDFICQATFSCVLSNGSPTCVPDGISGNGTGQGQVGDLCEDNTDCESPLTCQSNLNGDTTCQQ